MVKYCKSTTIVIIYNDIIRKSCEHGGLVTKKCIQIKFILLQCNHEYFEIKS